MSPTTLFDIEKALQKKSWWAIFFVLPLARRLSLFIVNHTNFSPNTITIFSFLFIPFAAVFFSSGTYLGLVLGALFFEINYLFDCIDGTVARVKKLSSPLGGYLDLMLDRWRIVIVSAALAYGQFKETGSLEVIFLCLLYLGLNNLILFTRNAMDKTLSKMNRDNTSGIDLTRSAVNSGPLAWWFKKTEDRNIMPYYHDIELDALVFVVGPLLNMVVPFLWVANGLAVVLIVALNIMFFVSLKKEKGTNKNA